MYKPHKFCFVLSEDESNLISVASRLSLIECINDSHCSDIESCQNNLCLPMTCNPVCRIDQVCKLANHKGVCSCAEGLRGDPHVSPGCGKVNLLK